MRHAILDSDDRLIESWLHDRPDNTQDSYGRDIAQFRAFVHPSALAEITLEAIQRYSTHLQERNLKNSTRKRKLNAVKSLFTFATQQAHIPFNVAAAIRLPKTNPNLAGRILTQEAVMALIKAGATERDRTFLLLMYAIGARVSEMCGLTWRDFTHRSNGIVQVTILGKGEKLRSVIVPPSVWEQLQLIRTSCERVFPFSRREAHNIIKRAVKSAGLDPKVSCHWVRHCHAIHAIANGAKIHVVRDTLGHSNISVTNWYLESMPDESSSDYLGLGTLPKTP